MIKDLNIIIYKEKGLRLFLFEKILCLNEDDIVEIIDKNVIEYTIEYNEGILYICYYNENYDVFVGEIDFSKELFEKVRIDKMLSYKDSFKKIDSIRLIVKNRRNIHILFRAWDKFSNKVYIFQQSLVNFNVLNKIAINDDHTNYNSSFKIATKDNKAYMLLCYDFEKGGYCLYDLFNNNCIGKFVLNNIGSIFFEISNKEILIFYNKLTRKDQSLYCKRIFVNDNKLSLGSEYRLPMPKNIPKFGISICQDKIFIVWDSNNNFILAISKDLGKWKIKFFDKRSGENIFKATIIKILDNKYMKIKSYVNFFEINQLLIVLLNKQDNFESKAKNCQEVECINKINETSNILNSQFSRVEYLCNSIEGLEKLRDIEEYYESICNNYLNTISSLRKSIEEKDEIILKLLNI